MDHVTVQSRALAIIGTVTQRAGDKRGVEQARQQYSCSAANMVSLNVMNFRKGKQRRNGRSFGSRIKVLIMKFPRWKVNIMLSAMESETFAMPGLKEEALSALAAKGEVQHNLANLPLCPPIRHAAFAAVMATLVGLPVLPLPWRFVALAGIFTSILLIVQWDKRRLGIFINGYRRGKTRMVTFPMLVIILSLYFGSDYFSNLQKKPAVSLALSAVAFLIGYFGSTLWQRVFVSELNAG